jgi:homoserine O-acetyltransferase
VGYETYGTLNAAGDNAILVCHFFSGNSHAAGRYKGEDRRGYWDSIIGSGKPVDTDKYFVLSVDTLANLNTKDRNTITTGPASIDPDTGKPYGMRFPVVTIRDFVTVQKAVADSLGIKKFRAVAGASMGALQAVEWAAAYPEMVERVISVIGGGLETNPYLIATLDLWSAPIRLDPKWNNGDYYGGEEPVDGLTAAMKMVLLGSRSYAWAQKEFGRKWAQEGKDPMADFANGYAVQAWLEAQSRSRAKLYDANSFLYLSKAGQLFQAGHLPTTATGVKRIKARIMLIPVRSDLLTFPDYSREAVEMILAQRGKVEFLELTEDGGHVDGIVSINKVGENIRLFVEE